MSNKLDVAEIKASGALPSPSGVLLSVIELCQREQVSLQDLSRAVLADPVLAGRIIKIANVANPNKSRPIAGVSSEVLILVGVHAVRALALCLSLLATKTRTHCPGFDYDGFWSRSLAMGCAAQALAVRIKSAPPVEMFSCGLLANVGTLALASVRSNAFSQILARAREMTPGELCDAERESFGVTHLELAGELMADWNIPRLFGEAVLRHENPATNSATPGSRQHCLPILLHLSAAIADHLLDKTGKEHLLPLAEGAGLNADQLDEIVTMVAFEWRDWCHAMGIVARRAA